MARLEAEGAAPSLANASDAQTQLIETVREAIPKEHVPPAKEMGFVPWLDMLGRKTARGYRTVVEMLGFFGLVLAKTSGVLVRPWRLRWTSLVHHMQEVGYNAVPIVSLMAFLIGVVLAFQGAVQLRQFGAEVFVVDLIAIALLRELGILLTAIIVAGRSGSAYTASIGSMKMREEIDAMRTLGLDPIEVLVVPRFLALLLMLPVLGIIANFAGLFGGAAMAWIELGVSPGMFQARMLEFDPRQQLSRRRDQGAVFRRDHRHHRLLPGHEGRGQRRVARTPDLEIRRHGDLPRHRRGRAVLRILFACRLLMDGGTLDRDAIIRVRGLRTQFGRNVVHENLDLDVYRGEVLGIVGGSGTGKSVLLRAIVGLLRPAAGSIEVFGTDVVNASDHDRTEIEQRWGVMFQGGALFSSLSVQNNVEAPMREHLNLSREVREALAELKVSMVGLPPDACPKYPSEFSGGMQKRAGLARALALDPEIVFLDEPTAGLDPIGAAAFDDLIRQLQKTLGPHRFHGDARSRQSPCDLRPCRGSRGKEGPRDRDDRGHA